jgi:hypothetical protein
MDLVLALSLELLDGVSLVVGHAGVVATLKVEVEKTKMMNGDKPALH